MARGGRWCLRLPTIGNVTVKATLTIGDVDPGAEDEGCTLLGYGGGVDDCHQVLLGSSMIPPT
jgi:hypothetical protein